MFGWHFYVWVACTRSYGKPVSAIDFRLECDRMGGVGGKEWHQIGDRPEPAAGCTTGTIKKMQQKKNLLFQKRDRSAAGEKSRMHIQLEKLRKIFKRGIQKQQKQRVKLEQVKGLASTFSDRLGFSFLGCKIRIKLVKPIPSLTIYCSAINRILLYTVGSAYTLHHAVRKYMHF